MTEWPKSITVISRHKLEDGSILEQEGKRDVIPADLGQELYKAAKRSQEFNLGHDELNRAVARYEREVNKNE